MSVLPARIMAAISLSFHLILDCSSPCRRLDSQGSRFRTVRIFQPTVVRQQCLWVLASPGTKSGSLSSPPGLGPNWPRQGRRPEVPRRHRVQMGWRPRKSAAAGDRPGRQAGGRQHLHANVRAIHTDRRTQLPSDPAQYTSQSPLGKQPILSGPTAPNRQAAENKQRPRDSAPSAKVHTAPPRRW